MLRRFLFTLLVVPALYAAPPPLDARSKQLTYDIYKQLIEINTTDSVGNTTAAAEAMAARLRAAGFPASDVKVLAPNPRKGNLVARLRGSGTGKPILLLAHLDVVEAKKEDWSVDPFTLTEKDAYYYGRGTGDDKAMAAMWIANLIRYNEEGQIAADMAAAANGDGAAQTRLSQTPVYNALMRTTCVATRLEGGHADNALPQSSRATVNCRVLPGESADEVRNTLATVLSDP